MVPGVVDVTSFGGETKQFHIKVDVLAEEYVAEGLLRSLSEFHLAGAKILIARGGVARDILPNERRARGAQVGVV